MTGRRRGGFWRDFPSTAALAWPKGEEYDWSTFIPFSMPSSRLQQRIDPSLRKEAEAILKTQGIKPSQAIILFYTEVTRSRGLPFRPSPVRRSEIPNARL